VGAEGIVDQRMHTEINIAARRCVGCVIMIGIRGRYVPIDGARARSQAQGRGSERPAYAESAEGAPVSSTVSAVQEPDPGDY